MIGLGSDKNTPWQSQSNFELKWKYLGDTLWPVQMKDELKAILAWGNLTLQITNTPETTIIHHHWTQHYIHYSPSCIHQRHIFQPTIQGQTCLVRTSEPSGAELATCLVELPFFFFPFLLFFVLDFPSPLFFLGRFFNLPVPNFFVFDLAVSLFTKPFLFLDSPLLLALALFFLDFEPPVFFRFWLILLPIFLEGESSLGASSGSTEGRCFGPFVPLTPHTAMQYLLRNTLFSKISYKMNDILNIHCWTKELTAFLPIIELVIGGTFWVGNKTLARSVNVTNKTKCD